MERQLTPASHHSEFIGGLASDMNKALDKITRRESAPGLARGDDSVPTLSPERHSHDDFNKDLARDLNAAYDKIFPPTGRHQLNIDR